MAKLRRKKRKKKEQGSHSVLISSFTRLKSVDFNLIYNVSIHQLKDWMESSNIDWDLYLLND